MIYPTHHADTSSGACPRATPRISGRPPPVRHGAAGLDLPVGRGARARLVGWAVRSLLAAVGVTCPTVSTGRAFVRFVGSGFDAWNLEEITTSTGILRVYTHV